MIDVKAFAVHTRVTGLNFRVNNLVAFIRKQSKHPDVLVLKTPIKYITRYQNIYCTNLFPTNVELQQK